MNINYQKFSYAKLDLLPQFSTASAAPDNDTCNMVVGQFIPEKEAKCPKNYFSTLCMEHCT